MRMAELSKESGVAVATIKYYLREGLLPPGERTSPNQANYTPGHVRRLKLVRALLDLGGLSISQVKEVLGAMDSPELGLHEIFGVAQRTITAIPADTTGEAARWAHARVNDLIADRRWQVGGNSAPRHVLVGVLATLRELGAEAFFDHLDGRAGVAERIAEFDVESIAGKDSIEAMIEGVIVGTVLGDAVQAALRRMAQESASARRFGVQPCPDDSP